MKRRFRFSLRTLTLIVALSTVGCRVPLTEPAPQIIITTVSPSDVPQEAIKAFSRENDKATFERIDRLEWEAGGTIYNFVLPDGSERQYAPDGQRAYGGVI